MRAMPATAFGGIFHFLSIPKWQDKKQKFLFWLA
jgi:hypothetical protein